MNRGRSPVQAGLRYVEAARIAVLSGPRLVRMRWLLDHDGYAEAKVAAESLGRQHRVARVGPLGTALIVNRVASLLPGRLNCLPRALTVWSFTRAAGYPTELKIGVAPRADAGRRIEAHAWVELNGFALAESTTRYVTMPVEASRPTPGSVAMRDMARTASEVLR